MYSPLPIGNLGSLELYFWTLDSEIQINVWCFFGMTTSLLKAFVINPGGITGFNNFFHRWLLQNSNTNACIQAKQTAAKKLLQEVVEY